MKKLNFGTVGLAAILAGIAVPAGATTISNVSSGSGATFTTAGVGNDIGAFNIVLNGNLNFANPFKPGIALVDVDLEYTGGTSTTVTVVETAAAATSGYAGISAGTVLFTYTLSAPLTLGAGSTSLVVPTITSVTGNGTFLSDIGIASSFATGLEFGTLSVQGSNSGTTFTPNSYGFAVSTPEPVSCVLFGSGVLVVGLMRRKKLFGSRS